MERMFNWVIPFYLWEHSKHFFLTLSAGKYKSEKFLFLFYLVLLQYSIVLCSFSMLCTDKISQVPFECQTRKCPPPSKPITQYKSAQNYTSFQETCRKLLGHSRRINSVTGTMSLKNFPLLYVVNWMSLQVVHQSVIFQNSFELCLFLLKRVVTETL